MMAGYRQLFSTNIAVKEWCRCNFVGCHNHMKQGHDFNRIVEQFASLLDRPVR